MQWEVNGNVREAIKKSIVRILVSVDGTVTVETKMDGLLWLENCNVQSGCRGGSNTFMHAA